MASSTQTGSRTILRSLWFPALAASRRAARATAPQEWLRHGVQIAPHLRSLWFPALAYGPHRATAPQEWLRHGVRIAPHLRSLWFPAFGYGPHRATAPQMALSAQTGSRTILRSLIFPALAAFGGGPLGPRLPKWPCRHRRDRALFCGASWPMRVPGRADRSAPE
jgi:hypothetical protein